MSSLLRLKEIIAQLNELAGELEEERRSGLLSGARVPEPQLREDRADAEPLPYSKDLPEFRRLIGIDLRAGVSVTELAKKYGVSDDFVTSVADKSPPRAT